MSKWYFVTKIVLTYCEKKVFSSNQEKLLKLEAEGREFAKLLRSLKQFIRKVKVQYNLNISLTCSWRFVSQIQQLNSSQKN